jgi:Raf kinase inhibitor-like YbhB/YbcL family protein
MRGVRRGGRCRVRGAAALGLGASIAAAALAQQGDGTRVETRTHVFKPAKVALTPQRLAQLKLPPGFAVNVFAQELKNARIVLAGPNDTVYVSRREQGDVLLLRDANHDGIADGPPQAVLNRPGAHGMALHDGKFYLVTVKQLFVGDLLSDGRIGPLKMLAGDLPDAGQHANRTIAFGPDGMLYLSVGSTCNACNEDNPENATLLRMSPDGKSRTIFASGLRNTIGFDWHPETGELWGLDHGIDFLGDEAQPEELNRIERGKRYGWPHIWGAGGENPQSTPPGEITKAQWKALSTPMVLGYAAHAAPMQMLFYRGSSFPAAYRSDAFATMRGSWNRDPASGYEIVRIRFSKGQPQAIEPFVSGFLTDGGSTHIARPVGLTMLGDGSLLMADDANGVLYRVAYTGAPRAVAGTGAAASTAAAPAGPMQQQAARGSGVPIASARPETEARTRMEVTSTSFAAGAPMPERLSEYADGTSPALAWSPVVGATSYVLVAEDPDARPVTPFVHWLAWNIVPTQLPEGLQKGLRLTAPPGLMQGPTTRGSPGYFGPRPPVGDPPHHYHFQLFALDTMLDLKPGADRDEVIAAMKGHVIAKGEIVGTYQQTQQPMK